MTPQDAVDRPVVTATVALTLLLLGSVVAYANDEIEAVPTRTRSNGTADELGAAVALALACMCRWQQYRLRPLPHCLVTQ